METTVHLVLLTAWDGGGELQQALPVSDMVNEVLFEHEAPPLNYIQQRRLEGPHINLHPAVKHPEGLQPAHIFVELLIGVDLGSELMEEGRVLWDAILCMGLDLLGGEDVPIQQELIQNLSAVLHVEVGIRAEGVSIAAAAGHDALHPLHELAPHPYQVGHAFHVTLGEEGHRGGLHRRSAGGPRLWGGRTGADPVPGSGESCVVGKAAAPKMIF